MELLKRKWKWYQQRKSIAYMIKRAIPSKSQEPRNILADATEGLFSILAFVGAITAFCWLVFGSSTPVSEITFLQWVLVGGLTYTIFKLVPTIPRICLILPIIWQMYMGAYPSRFWVFLSIICAVWFEFLLGMYAKEYLIPLVF